MEKIKLKSSQIEEKEEDKDEGEVEEKLKRSWREVEEKLKRSWREVQDKDEDDCEYEEKENDDDNSDDNKDDWDNNDNNDKKDHSDKFYGDNDNGIHYDDKNNKIPHLTFSKSICNSVYLAISWVMLKVLFEAAPPSYAAVTSAIWKSDTSIYSKHKH